MSGSDVSDLALNRRLKLLLLGEASVGKTTQVFPPSTQLIAIAKLYPISNETLNWPHRICHTLISGEYDELIQPTVGLEYQRTELIVDNVRVPLDVFDIAGEHKFEHLMKKLCRNIDGALIVFDVSNRRSVSGNLSAI